MVVIKVIIAIGVALLFGFEVYGLIKALVERRKKKKEEVNVDNKNKE